MSAANEQLQEVTVPAVVQVQNQRLAHVGLQAEAELPDRSCFPTGVTRPLAGRAAKLQGPS